MLLECATLTPTTHRGPGMRPRNPNWLRVTDAAAVLEVDASTLWRWKTKGQLDQVRTEKFGKFTYYWKPDLETLRDRLEAGPEE